MLPRGGTDGATIADYTMEGDDMEEAEKVPAVTKVVGMLTALVVLASLAALFVFLASAYVHLLVRVASFAWDLL